MQIPDKVTYIIDTLQKNGHEAFAVGGCVRDTVLGRMPEDWDITTSARPEEIKACFRRTIDTGIQHGTVTVMLDKEGFEVTTYRIDGEYEDMRHPKQVQFTRNLKADLERRDFTINAMAYNPSTGIVDIFSGMEDIEKGVIRCVGDAGQRFDEDALRMLRAVRFSGQLGFAIEEKTAKAIRKRVKNLALVSSERIRVEMDKLLMSGGADRIRDIYKLGLSDVFLPELKPMMETEQKNYHHIYSVGEHTIKAIQIMNSFFGEAPESEIPGNILEEVRRQTVVMDKRTRSILCWTMLLHDVAKPACFTEDENGTAHFYGHPEKGEKMAKEILRRLTFDNYRTDMICRLIRFHDYHCEPNKKAVRRAMSKIGADILPCFFLVVKADTLAQNPETFTEKLERLRIIENYYREIMEAGECLQIRDLAVDGNDLIKAGIQPGREIGAALQMLLDYILENPQDNKKEILLEQVKKYINRQNK